MNLSLLNEVESSLETDIAIVGAGPIGTLAAIQASRNKAEVIVLEQRATIGVPDHCAGLISKTGLKKIGLDSLPKSIVQSEKIIGAKIYSPDGTNLTVKRNSTQALVVDRTLFDQYLATKAENSGATILRNSKVTNLQYNNITKKITMKIKNKLQPSSPIKSLTAPIAIISEGRLGRLAKSIGFQPPKKKYRLSGFQYLIENVSDLDTQFVEMYFSNFISSGFFTWIIPISENTAKVGLATRDKDAVFRLNYFLKKHPITKHRFQKAKIIKKYGGEVIVSGLMKKTSTNGVMVAGDAAGQTKATTGGGVITGGLAGIIAGQVASLAIQKNNNSSKFLKKYDTQWKAILRNQLKAMSLFRWLLNRLTDEAFNRAFETAVENDLGKLIEEKGDIDSQAEIILSLLKDPAVIKLAFKLLPTIQF